MKARKVYIIPAVNTVKIRPVTMMATSYFEEEAKSYSEEHGIAGDDNGDVYARKSLDTWEEW